MTAKKLKDHHKRFVIALETLIYDGIVEPEEYRAILRIYAKSFYKAINTHQFIYPLCKGLEAYFADCQRFRIKQTEWRERSRAGEILPYPKDVDLPAM